MALESFNIADTFSFNSEHVNIMNSHNKLTVEVTSAATFSFVNSNAKTLALCCEHARTYVGISLF